MAIEFVTRVGERGVYEYSFDYTDLWTADGVISLALSKFPTDKLYRITDVVLRKTADFVHGSGESLYITAWVKKGGGERQVSILLPQKVTDSVAAKDYGAEHDQPGMEIHAHGSILDMGAASGGKSVWAEMFGTQPSHGGLPGFFVPEACYLTDWYVLLVPDGALGGAGTITLTPQVCPAGSAPTIGNHAAPAASLDSFKTGTQLNTAASIAFTAASALYQTQTGLLVPIPAASRLTVNSTLDTAFSPVDLSCQVWMRLIPQNGPGWMLRNRSVWAGDVKGSGTLTLSMEAYLQNGNTKLLSSLTAGAARLLVFYEEVR